MTQNSKFTRKEMMSWNKHSFLDFMQNNTKFTYFTTLTFDSVTQQWSTEEKLKALKSFINSLSKKKKFKYFWVLEKANQSDNKTIHIHMLSDWNYNFGFIRQKWNQFLRIKPNIRTTHIENISKKPIKEYHSVVKYLFKQENISNWSMSTSYYSSFGEYLTEKDKKLPIPAEKALILTNYAPSNLNKRQFSTFKRLFCTFKTATIEDQFDLEGRMTQILTEKGSKPRLMDWIRKLNRVIKKEKAQFIKKLDTTKDKDVVWYLKELKDSGKTDVWNNLLFYYVANALRKVKINVREHFANTKMMLLYIKTGKIKWKLEDFQKDQTESDIWTRLSFLFEVYFKETLSKFIKIEEFREENITFKRFHLLKLYSDIDWNPNFADYKGKMPMIVKPKDWTLSTDDGGYLYNGLAFSMNLCKNKNSSYLTILNQEVIDNLNYLQQVPYRINVELLDYINKNTLDIQKNIFRHVNREEFESEIKMLTNEVNEIYELASKGVKNASKIKLNKESSVKAAELLTKKNKLTALLTQFDKFHGILNVANELSVYKSIYFVLQLDFRGRIYTVSDFLNYQGGDLARSLVTLQKKCKFNLYWFKIYCLKKYGFDVIGKNIDQMHALFDSELQPLMLDFENGSWFEAKKPFEFLNCCLEYKRYLENPEYESYFTIYFDATCSGSQLITLLMGIDTYIKDLNLSASTKQDELQDYYIRIIKDYKIMLYKEIKDPDIIKTIENVLKTPAMWRKFFKNIIMTFNYGLTAGGLRVKMFEQESDLKERIPWFILEVMILTFDRFINEVSLVKSLNLFTEITKEVAENNKEIEFYSAYTGFVESEEGADYKFKQAYNESEVRKIKIDRTDKDYGRIQRQYSYRYINPTKIDIVKQKIAIKANIIHHLDAIWIHNCLNSFKNDKNFGGICVIHDCFGVCFDDIDKLNRIVRSCLVSFFQNNTQSANNLIISMLKSKYNQKIIPESEEKRVQSLVKKHFKDNTPLLKDLEFAYYLIFPG